jgi:hypothetical protein
MSSIWFRDLGFHNNPFSIKPAAYHDQVLGYDKVVDEVSYAILNNKLVVLEGEYGFGKSSILRRVLNDFGGKKQVIYYSCNRMEARLNIKRLLNGKYGFWGRLFDMKPKDMILLLDEAQVLGPKDFQKIHSYFQEGYFKSVVLVGKGINKENIANGLKAKLQDIQLEQIDEETAVKVIRKRIGQLDVLSDPMVKRIFKRSDNNVRKLLKNCEEACKYAVQSGRKRVNEDVIAYVFKDEKEESVPKAKEAKETKEASVAKKETKKVTKKATKTVKKKPAKEEKSPPKAQKIYNPETYKDMVNSSAEDLLNKSPDEMF